jgi:hypothetical protein
MVKLLTIGNSFADNATKYIEAIFEADGEKSILLGRANPGGCSLEKHWNLFEQCEMLPDVKPYDFYMTEEGTRKATLKEALVSQKWDYVTLQQVSDLSWREETYFPFMENLYNLVRELAPQAEIVIHQTWAYRVDAEELKRYGIDQTEMFNRLKDAYDKASKRLGCSIIPSGEAFQKARAIFNYTPDTNYNFDAPKPLQLPEQSRALIVGYYWATGNTPTGKAELRMDGRHGNPKGCYLANAMWFEKFSGKSILENSFCPEGVSPEELEILKKVAHETMAEALK